MLLNFRCRRCRAPLSVESDRKDTMILCPACHCELVVPAGSEPNVPRGRPVLETFAMREETVAEKTNPSILPEQAVDGLTPHIPFPSEKATDKPKKKVQAPQVPKQPPPGTRGGSRKSLAIAAGILLVIVAGVSALYLRNGSAPAPSPSPETFPPLAQVELRTPAADSPEMTLGLDLPNGQTMAVLLDRSFTTPPGFRGSLEPESEKQLAAVPAPPPAVAKQPNPAPASTAHVFKRRQKLSEEDLKKELRWAKEIPPMTSATMSQLMNRQMERFRSFGDIDFEPRVLLEVRPDLRTLPVRHGSPIKLDARAAEALQVFSRRLHYLVDNTVPRKADGEHVKPEWMRERMSKEVSPGHRPAWVRPEAVPALRQILMAEDKPLRWLLIELLAENSSPAASAALAQRAVFELSADLRQRAIEALQGRPPQDFRFVLLNGLHYPWPPAADHAAEALVALNDREAVPSLITYLKKPDPNQPFQTSQNHTLVREVVRIHHQSNCLMCHSPAVTGWKDPVAGPVPGVFLSGTIEGQAGGYHSSPLPKLAVSPLLVRADIVFMRQDFSVPVSVGPAGAGLPAEQRFDFLIRTRPIKAQELSEFKTAVKTSSYPQREGVLWALRELTGKDAGPVTADWVRLFPRAELDVEAARLSVQLVQTRGVKQSQLLAKFKDREGDAYTQALAEAIPQIKGKHLEQARQALAERLSRMDVPLLRDRFRDEDREIRRAAATASALKALDDRMNSIDDLGLASGVALAPRVREVPTAYSGR